jgi:hypothetical protein
VRGGRLIVAILLTTAALALSCPRAGAFPWEAAWGSEVQAWRLKGGDGPATLRQTTIPMWLHGRPDPSLDVWISGAWAQSRLERRAAADMTGFERIGGTLVWKPGPKEIRLIAGLRWGGDSPRLASPEHLLAEYLAEPALEWSVPLHGGGLETQIGALYAIAGPLGSGTLGVAWNRRGSYDPGSGASFDPSDDLRFAAALQRGTPARLWRADVAWTVGGTMKLDDRVLLDQGERWDASVEGETRIAEARLWASAGVRSYGSAVAEPLDGSAHPVVAAQLWSLGAGAKLGSGRWSWGLAAGYLSSPDAPTGRNGGYGWRLEGAATRALGPSAAVALRGGPTWGRLDNGGAAAGWRLGLGLFYRPGAADAQTGTPR